MKSASLDSAKFSANPFALAFRPWLNRITHGRLRLTLPSGDVVVVGEGQEAALKLHSWKGLRRILFQGAIGFADGYIAGEWSTPDLVELLRFCAANAESLQGISGGPVHRLFNRLRHKFRRNSKRGSRRNIISHYDLGNDFFRLWLDPTMLYSSALYETGEEKLEAAQQARLKRILSLMQISGGEKVLEIGCGWGELARRMAEAGADVVGLTISPSQLEAAQAKCEGLNTDLRLQDYRDVEGQFDRVVSIEMIEAVGEAYWPAYFGKIAEVLKPGGTALLQAITITERFLEDYRENPDFIQRYIFPGGFLPTKTAIDEQAAKAGLTLVKRECFGLSYARTLRDWRERFDAKWLEATALGFDERFRRLWTYYLCYCEAGFLEGATDVGFYLLQKPEIAR